MRFYRTEAIHVNVSEEGGVAVVWRVTVAADPRTQERWAVCGPLQ